MQQLFDDIVRVFVATCRATGLSYPELNILVYCLLAPLSWLLVLALRRPRLGGPLVLGAALLIGALTVERRRFAPLSRWFYDYNIRVLELAGRYTGLGYVAVSLLVPRRAVLPLAAAFAALLLLYFVVGWFAL
ncbi:hypothetical protein [Hymenobacter jeollabukensis]|uniref:Uncharacterized protein n=1 Tax=Hymenobacter jeollabukensis TaxID=2025313 RepID=A0A5R8WLM1_9BACT|nr:hypothetical protein [Hymenobacter jeollabukensis]TLM90080.1 hypothetical protein FDY95_18870 [Hymenobacter jeollabukensis]